MGFSCPDKTSKKKAPVISKHAVHNGARQIRMPFSIVSKDVPGSLTSISHQLSKPPIAFKAENRPDQNSNNNNKEGNPVYSKYADILSSFPVNTTIDVRARKTTRRAFEGSNPLEPPHLRANPGARAITEAPRTPRRKKKATKVESLLIDLNTPRHSPERAFFEMSAPFSPLPDDDPFTERRPSVSTPTVGGNTLKTVQNNGETAMDVDAESLKTPGMEPVNRKQVEFTTQPWVAKNVVSLHLCLCLMSESANVHAGVQTVHSR